MTWADLPWEGRPDEEHTLRRGYPEQINIGYLDASGRTISFALPATVYSGPNNQSVSPSKVIAAEEIALNLEVREVETEGFQRHTITIRLDPNNGQPEIALGGPMPLATPVTTPTRAQEFIAPIIQEKGLG